jgi:hypothetical protein
MAQVIGIGPDLEVWLVTFDELAVLEGGASAFINGSICFRGVVGLQAEQVLVLDRIVGVRRDEVGCQSLCWGGGVLATLGGWAGVVLGGLGGEGTLRDAAGAVARLKMSANVRMASS